MEFYFSLLTISYKQNLEETLFTDISFLLHISYYPKVITIYVVRETDHLSFSVFSSGSEPVEFNEFKWKIKSLQVLILNSR